MTDYQNNGGFLSDDTPDESTEQAKKGELVPLTVRQLINSTQSSIDGYPADCVSIIGRVHSFSYKDGMAEIEVGDGTGYVKVKWYTTKMDNKPIDQLETGTCIKCFGNVKAEYTDSTLLAYKCTRITSDYNAITRHFLEAIYVHLVRHGLHDVQKEIDEMTQGNNGRGGAQQRYKQQPQQQQNFGNGGGYNNYQQQPQQNQYGGGYQQNNYGAGGGGHYGADPNIMM